MHGECVRVNVSGRRDIREVSIERPLGKSKERGEVGKSGSFRCLRTSMAFVFEGKGHHPKCYE